MKISVVIPMYNAEKYIGDCLDSLLAQTLQDFEVIVVDDCSTDSSCAVVQSYAGKFGGRLKLARTKKNSGGGGYVPRNIGLNLSRGKYIFFADADDFLAENGLEILYAAAEKVEADVVYTAACHYLERNGKLNLMTDSDPFQDNPTLTLDDPNENLRRLFFDRHFRNPWTKFSRRDFLIENEIFFPKIISGGDFIWTIHVYCCVKKFLRLPTPIYFYRNYSAESVSRKKRTAPEQVYHWAAAFAAWLEAFNSLARKMRPLRENPVLCVQASLLHFYYCLNSCAEAQRQLDMQDIYEKLSREFPDDSPVPFFFSLVAAQQKELEAARRRSSSAR